jgi:hypothetical protein
MPYSRFINNSRPGPYVKDYVYDGLVFTHMKFKTGDWMTIEYVGSGLMSEMASQHIQPTGYRQTVDGLLPDMAAGSMTRYETFAVEPCHNKRVATEDTDLWCCKVQGSDEASTSYVSSVRIDVDEPLAVLAGENVFLVHGQIQVGDTQFVAPQLVICSSNQTIESVNGVAYAFKWTALEAV